MAKAQTSPAREAELIERVLGGEKELFYELVQPYERGVFLAALSVLGNPADAEEIAQEAILKAFRNLKDFRGEAKFSTWLIRIALNEARMRQRRTLRVPFDSLDETQEDEEGFEIRHTLADWRELPAEAVERAEVRRELARALEALPAKYREVLLMRDVQQMSIEETAEALGISRGLVKTRLFRARIQMRDLLVERLGKEPFSVRRWFKKGKKPW